MLFLSSPQANYIVYYILYYSIIDCKTNRKKNSNRLELKYALPRLFQATFWLLSWLKS